MKSMKRIANHTYMIHYNNLLEKDLLVIGLAVLVLGKSKNSLIYLLQYWEKKTILTLSNLTFKHQ